MNRGSVLACFVQAGCDDSASMRPRFMNRGSAASARHPPLMIFRFNEAPIHESGKFRAYTCGSCIRAPLQ